MTSPFEYYLFYKPYQVLSAFSSNDGKKTLADYFQGFRKDIYPVGRLDYDSEGLLLLTNDKSLNQALLHPRHQHEREYWVQVEGSVEQAFFERLKSGLTINHKGIKHRSLPVTGQIEPRAEHLAPRTPPIRYRKNIPTTWVSLILKEGKNRQVRKLTAAASCPTLRLVRWRIEQLSLEGLEPGDIRSIPDMRKYLVAP